MTFDGTVVPARQGESLAAALIAARHYAFRRTAKTGERGVFCGMGVCSECALEVGGEAGRLACMERVVPGLALGLNPPARRLEPCSQPVAASRPCPRKSARATCSSSAPAPPGCERQWPPSGPGPGPGSRRAGRGRGPVLQTARRFDRPSTEPGIDAQYRAGRALLREAQEGGVEILHGTRVWGQLGPPGVLRRLEDGAGTSFATTPLCWPLAPSSGACRSPAGRCQA